MSRMLLLRDAPWLAEGLTREARAALSGRLTAGVECIDAGTPNWRLGDTDGVVALALVEGFLLAYLGAADADAAVLLGPGEVMRPWTFSGWEAPVPQRATWTCLSPCRFAVLDAEFQRAARSFPALNVALIERIVERARTNSYMLAITRARRVESRILMMLWHFADRWGRVTSDGVALDVPGLTHERLGDLICVRRPSVTTALGRLRELGALTPAGRGRWLLRGDPNEFLADVQDVARTTAGTLDGVEVALTAVTGP